MLNTRKFISLATYFVLATGMAAFVRLGIIDPFKASENGFLAGMLNSVVFIGWTPAIAAFLVWKLFGSEDRRSSWTGYSMNASIMIALVPAFVLGVHGIPNDIGVSPRVFGAILGALIFVYALGEEIGWRGFMHDALSPRAIWLRAVIISIPWFLWHLPFAGSTFDLIVALKGLGIIALAAFFLSQVSEESGSWMICGGFHALGNIGFMGSAVNLPSNERLILAGISFVVMLLIYRWQKPSFKIPSPPA